VKLGGGPFGLGRGGTLWKGMRVNALDGFIGSGKITDGKVKLQRQSHITLFSRRRILIRETGQR
jgi:hypothetical protein